MVSEFNRKGASRNGKGRNVSRVSYTKTGRMRRSNPVPDSKSNLFDRIMKQPKLSDQKLEGKSVSFSRTVGETLQTGPKTDKGFQPTYNSRKMNISQGV